MSGTFAIKEDDSFVSPGKQVTFGLGEVIEGHISIVLSAVEDPDLDQTLVPGELKLELLRNGSVFLTSGQLTASVVNDSTSVWQVRLTSNIHTRNVLFHIWIEYPVPDAAAILTTDYTLDESEGGTLRHWSSVVRLPPVTPGTLVAQTIDAPFGAQITLDFMIGPQVIASAHNQLLSFTLTGSPPITLRVTIDTPPAETTAVTVRVTYPSTRRVITRKIPLAFFTRVFDEFWNNRIPQPFRLSVVNHTVAITFDPDLKREQNLEDISFPLPAFSVSIEDIIGIPDIPIKFDVKITGVFSKAIRFSTGVGKNPIAEILVPPAPSPKYDQAAYFAVDIEVEEPGPSIEVAGPDIDLHNVSLRLEFYLTALGESVFFMPKAIVKIGSAHYAGVGVSDPIASTASDELTDALSRDIKVAQLGQAVTPWLLGEPLSVRAAGSRFGEIWIDYVEPPPQLIVATPRVPVVQGNLQLVKHIVVLMMENRSFDHMLGYLSLTPRDSGKPVNGLKGNESNAYKGQEFKTFSLHKTIFPVSPAHGFVPTQNQISNHMGGFVASFAEKYENAGLDVSLIMGHYDREMLLVYDQLATQFKICDNWHAAHPGPTWPNRFITVTGRLNQDQFGQFERDNPNLATFTPSEATTLFDILTANNITWRYYENGYSFIRLFTRYTFDTTNVRGFSRFEDDARVGDLPQVIFIDPDFIEFPPGADDQAPSNPIDGQIFVGTVVNALLGSPAWRDTLLLVTYDEHGGFYDHVEPPATPVKFEGEMDRYGLRVPTFIVSPYVDPGDVSSQFFDHASIQATIQRTFLGPMAPDLGPRVAHTADVGPLLTRQQPRLSIPPLMLPPPPDPLRRAARPQQLPFPSQDSEEFNDLLFLARMFTGMGPA